MCSSVSEICVCKLIETRMYSAENSCICCVEYKLYVACTWIRSWLQVGFDKFRHTFLFTRLKTKIFKGIVGNRALPSLHEGSFKITITVPLQKVYFFSKSSKKEFTVVQKKVFHIYSEFPKPWEKKIKPVFDDLSILQKDFFILSINIFSTKKNRK